MADYTPTQNFTALRGTTPADPAIFDTEFVAVQTAVATKLDKTGGTLTGSLTGTSASFPSGVTANITGDVTGNVTGNILGTPSITATNITGTAAGLSIGGNAATAASASAVPWSGVSSTPTTIAGYGITNAVSNDIGAIGIGCFAFAAYNSIGSGITAGSTYAGSALFGGINLDNGTGENVSFVNTLASGTWRAMLTVTGATGVYSSTTFQRIS